MSNGSTLYNSLEKTKVSIQRVINTNYVKYDKMVQIINDNYANSSIDKINIYIDLVSIVKSIYGRNVNIENYSDLTACVINMCAHYRAFFETRYKTESKFYIILSATYNRPPSNVMTLPEYNAKTAKTMAANQTVTDMVCTNIELLTTLTPYLSDISFIQRTAETSVIAYDLMQQFDLEDKEAHIMITKDPYNYRLAIMKPNTIIIRPKKLNGEDVSEVININNILNEYFESRGVAIRSEILHPCHITTLMALCGSKDRNIKSLCNITKAVKGLEDLINKKLIPNSYKYDPALFDNLETKLGIPSTIIGGRFRSFDIAFQQLVYTQDKLNINYALETQNLVDNNSIRFINDKYFKLNPLDLNRL